MRVLSHCSLNKLVPIYLHNDEETGYSLANRVHFLFFHRLRRITRKSVSLQSFTAHSSILSHAAHSFLKPMLLGLAPSTYKLRHVYYAQ
jgi:hypothetical protein